MTAYYNEFDEKAAAWLRELIKQGHIADGVVDTRSIVDVRPDELAEFTQCHFFAGIGVWSYALRRAGWADDRPMWTMSCPCQPFSAAGKGGGFDDERHLWPHAHWLISQCRPPIVAGEQVASKDGLGWLNLVQADLEGTGYAVGEVDLCAAGVGAPHIRQRLWWFGKRLADADEFGWVGRRAGEEGLEPGAIKRPERLRDAGRLGDDDARLEGQRGGHQASGRWIGEVRPIAETGQSGGVADAESGGRSRQPIRQGAWGPPGGNAGHSELGGVGDTDCQRERTVGRVSHGPGAIGEGGILSEADSRPGPTNGFWRDADWLYCRDGKWRPVGPGSFPLADGASARVGRLRGYGNAIVAQAAQAFIESVIEATTETIDLRLNAVSEMTANKDIFS
ncbi:MAG: DNA cytosine methyltransferase [Hyphomicrobium sp.]|jgi:DNA (cytosine-5)-methyltransferase 1